MAQGVRSGPGSRFTVFQLAELLFLAAVVCFWALEFSLVILQSDDLLNAGLAGRPDAGMSVVEWWNLYRHDYLHVNGRFTDAAVRIVLQGGRTAWAIVGPILMGAVTIGGAAWITGRLPGSRTPSWQTAAQHGAALALVAALPLSMIAFRPAVAGDGIFWLSAALTHLGSAVCILVAGWPFLAKVSGRPVSKAVLWIAPPFMVLAAISQETAAVTTIAIVGACWILLKGRVGRYLGLLTLVSLISFAYLVCSPGLVGRASQFQAQASDTLPLGQQLLHRGVVSAQIWLTMGAAGAIGVTVLATALLWIGVRSRDVARSLAIPLTALAVLLLIIMWQLGPWSGTFDVIPRDEFTGLLAGKAAGLVACLVGVCSFGIGATYVLRRLVGPAPFVLVTGGAAALAVPTSLGITGERAYLISSLWWGFTAICLVLALARRAGQTGTSVASALAVAALFAVAPTAREINLAMTENYAVWESSARQISDALEDGGGAVSVGPFPYPAYMCWAAFDEVRYGDYFRLYYGIPPDVDVDFRLSPPVS